MSDEKELVPGTNQFHNFCCFLVQIYCLDESFSKYMGTLPFPEGYIQPGSTDLVFWSWCKAMSMTDPVEPILCSKWKEPDSMTGVTIPIWEVKVPQELLQSGISTSCSYFGGFRWREENKQSKSHFFSLLLPAFSLWKKKTNKSGYLKSQ